SSTSGCCCSSAPSPRPPRALRCLRTTPRRRAAARTGTLRPVPAATTWDDEVMNSSAPDAPTASVPLPDGVALVTSHGVDALRVDTAAATAEVLLDGAHLVSWTPAGQTDLLWLSPDSRFGAGEAARG